MVKSKDIDPSFDPDKKSDLEVKLKLFEIFWQNYPNRVKRKSTLQMWNKLKEDQIEQILRVMPMVKEYYTQKEDETSFIPAPPHPTSFINQERWNDEQYLTPQKKSNEGGDFGKSMSITPANPSVVAFVENLRDLSDGEGVEWGSGEKKLLQELNWSVDEALEEWYCYQNTNTMIEMVLNRLENLNRVAS